MDHDTEVVSDQYVRGVERLLRAVQELSLARDLEAIQQIVRTTARELTGSDGATFVLRDEGQCFYADEDAIEPLWKGSRFPMGACISGWTMLNRQPAIIPDIYADERIPHAAYRPTFVKSLVMVPIRSLDPVGAIGNYWADGHLATDEEVRLLQALADATSVAMATVQVHEELEQRVADRTSALEVANAAIRHLSITDDLTGLLNRRGFHEAAERRLAEARAEGRDCFVAFIDVDGLKLVNDSLGHEVGDAMILDIAEALTSVVRQDDLLARMGGDEFCVLVVGPPADGAQLADRIGTRFELLNAASTLPYRLSVSVGWASTIQTPDATLEQLVLQADVRMYEHKRARSAGR